MFLKTHLIIAVFFVLVFFSFISSISNPFIFIPVALIATLLPDIDTKFSKIGKIKFFRIFNFFLKHRGVMHSFTFLFVVSLVIFLFSTEILVPFSLAYSLHLLLDALTIQGIPVFYPLKFRIRGKMKTGGIFEKVFLISFFLIDLFLLFSKIYLIVK